MSNVPVRMVFGQEIIRLAEQFDYVAVCADTKCCSFEEFGDIYPRRQISVGIAEQNMLGVAAGLASCGHKTVLATYSTFATMRSCEQMRTYIAHPKLDVIIMGTHAGLQSGSEGVSHTAVEDIAILRGIPNMTIIHPSDDISARVLARKALEFHGPLYVRLPFDSTEDINDINNYDIEIGKANWIRREGGDVTLIASGILLGRTVEAANELAKTGIRAKVLEMHTLKPIDSKAILTAANETGAIVTIEDHSVIGGLGSAVAQVLAVSRPVPMRFIGILDRFAYSGDASLLYKENRMTIEDIVNAAKDVIRQKRSFA